MHAWHMHANVHRTISFQLFKFDCFALAAGLTGDGAVQGLRATGTLFCMCGLYFALIHYSIVTLLCTNISK